MMRADIIALIETHRLPLSDEKDLQAELAAVLGGAGISYRREVRLSATDIVDFMVWDLADSQLSPDDAVSRLGAPALAIEVKIKGQRRAIYRQLERYCAHDDVAELVLATNVPMGLPDAINGKPVALARLSRGWL